MDTIRPSFEVICMNFAVQISERSTCRRVNKEGKVMRVGCCIVSDDFRQVSLGFNGNASGLSNHCDDSNAVGGCGCLHAELNAALNCHIPRDEDKIVFATHLPCVACAKALINVGARSRAKRNGITKVYYLNDYRIRDSLKMFEAVGIETAQFEPPDVRP